LLWLGRACAGKWRQLGGEVELQLLVLCCVDVQVNLLFIGSAACWPSMLAQLEVVARWEL
jgi:hypothetical protein